MPSRGLTPGQVALIRKQRGEGNLDSAKWARALGVHRETILRAARGDSYADPQGLQPSTAAHGVAQPGLSGVNPTAADSPTAEPSEGELAALRRLTAALDAAPPSPREVLSLLDEMAASTPRPPSTTKDNP